MTLLINGVLTTLDNSLQTWGDLVSFLDDRLSAAQEVMTVVRLDGVEEPAFRDPSVCAGPLTGLSVVEVETGEPCELARRCLGDAAAAISALSVATKATADQFRCGEIDGARQSLEQVTLGLVTVLRIVTAAGLALRRELDVVDTKGRSVRSLSGELDTVVRRLVDAQQQADWLLVADVLEFDLLPTLGGWQFLLARISGTPLAH